MKITKYLYKYISPRLLFALDFFLSFLSTAVVLLVLNFYSTIDYNGPFAVWCLLGSIVFTVASILIFRVDKIVVRHLTIRDFSIYLEAAVCKSALLLLTMSIVFGFDSTFVLCFICDGMLTLSLVMCSRIAMLVVYDFYKSKVEDAADCKRMLVYGTSSKSVAAVKRFATSKHHRILGFVSNNTADRNMKMGDLPVYYYKDVQDLVKIAQSRAIHSILFMTSDDLQNEKDNLIPELAKENIKSMILPGIEEYEGRPNNKTIVRDVRIEDLLGRPEIKISMDAIKNNCNGKTVMVTGAAGSIGSELCRQLAGFGVKQLILFDDAETPMHNLRLELEAKFPELNFVPFVGSVRHGTRVEYAMKKWHPQVVFHAAAYKHVPLMEENPCEAVLTNVVGSSVVADKCVENDVEMMVMISTDKAVNPTNVMGCSKRLAEIYVQSLGLAMERGQVQGKTKFVTTRFGNVLGSNGSVIPRFREQIANGGPVTVTHPDINRFFMTIPEACRLVMEAATLSTGNQIFVFDMGKPVKIYDLAKRMIDLAGLKLGEDIQILFTGLRPGEKLYEEVLANSENTLPTSHDRIRIAKVREYDYEQVKDYLTNLKALAKAVDIPEMIKLMKKIVPEYKSNNSIFEQYDKINT